MNKDKIVDWIISATMNLIVVIVALLAVFGLFWFIEWMDRRDQAACNAQPGHTAVDSQYGDGWSCVEWYTPPSR